MKDKIREGSLLQPQSAKTLTRRLRGERRLSLNEQNRPVCSRLENLKQGGIYLSMLLLVLFPTAIFADASLLEVAQQLSFAPPSGDASVSFLTKIFGMVPGVPQMALGGTTIVGKIFGVFNIGILALCPVFLSYTIFRILVETSVDGSAMGKSSTMWTAVRCALSTSLLVPNAAGYSMANSIIMWVVMQSIGLADLTWNHALDYLKTGAPLYASVPTLDLTLIDYAVESDTKDTTLNSNINNGKTALHAGSADVLRSLTCAHIVRNTLISSQNTTFEELQKKGEKNFSGDDRARYLASQSVIGTSGDPFAVYYEVSDKHAVQFPYLTTDPLINSGLHLKNSAIPKLSGICGTISYDTEKDSKKSGTSKTAAENAAENTVVQNYLTAKRQGLLDMIAALNPIAESIARRVALADDDAQKLDPRTWKVYNNLALANTRKEGADTKSAHSQISDKTAANINWPFGATELLNAASIYQASVEPAQSAGGTSVMQERKNKLEKAKEQGWIAAGSYYRLLSDIGDNIAKEYTRYRLKNRKGLGTDEDYESGKKRTKYGALIPALEAATQGKSSGGGLSAFGQTANTNLEYALHWINLIYPYAVLEGKIARDVYLSRAQTSATKTGTLGSTSASLDALYKGNWFSAAGTAGLIAKITTAAVLSLNPITAALGLPFWGTIPGDVLNIAIKTVMDAWVANMDNPKLDPIIKLQNVGEAMIKAGLDVWHWIFWMFSSLGMAMSLSALVVTATSWVIAALSFMGATVGGSIANTNTLLAIQGVNTYILAMILSKVPICLAITTPIFLSGVVLAIYVPVIPYLLFLFGSISWLISVLVLMAASPIICFLMLWGNASQENPLLSREAEQFVMQIVGVFVRPTLMVIGLITGMVLARVGVDILNSGFSGVFDAIYNGGGTDETLIKIKLAGAVVVYTFAMVSIVNLSFSTIHLLYSEAMRVAGISAPAVGMEEKHVDSIKGSVTQFAEAGASGAREGATSPKGAEYKGSSKQDKNGEKSSAGGETPSPTNN